MTTTTTPDFTTPQPASSTSPAPENCCEKIIFQSNGGVKDFYHEALGNTQKELFLKIPALFLHTSQGTPEQRKYLYYIDIDISLIMLSISLFRKKRFEINFFVRRNASKCAIFIEKEKPRSFFRFPF